MSISEYYEVLSKKSVQNIDGQVVAQSDWASQLAEQFARTDGSVPPLSQQVFPGDSVVIAVAANVPRPAAIVRQLFQLLSDAGTSTDQISVVSNLPKPNGFELSIDWLTHDPEDSESMAMVGVSRGGEQLYLNSHLANADVVIPVVLAGNGKSASGYLYPAMSSSQTMQRLQDDSSLLIEEAVEAEQLVSPFYVVGVVPAPGDEIGTIIVDVRGPVDRQGAELRPQFWTTSPIEYQAVVGTLGTEKSAVDIIALLKGMQNLSQMVLPNGPIVVLANLTTKKRSSTSVESQGIEASEDQPSTDPDEDLSEDEQGFVDSMEMGQDETPESSERNRHAEQQDDSSDEFDFGDDFDDEDNQVEDDEDESDWNTEDDSEAASVPSEAMAGYHLSCLLEDLRSHQPVFLVSNLTSSQTEALGFGTLSAPGELSNLLDGLENVGVLRDAERWEIS